MLILASSSPQRKNILRRLGVPFRVIPSRVSEAVRGVKTPAEIVQKIALKKAESVARRHPRDWVIGVDTLVFLPNGKKVGKPKNKKEAKKIIRRFSGNFCEVLSGIAILCREKNQSLVTSETTRLHFRKIHPKEIEDYLVTGEWKNRSGAMTLEGRGGAFVTKMTGDYWNVIGFPVTRFRQMEKITHV